MKTLGKRGDYWFVCVDDGEVLFFDHNAAFVCDFIVHLEHSKKTHWTSGQPCHRRLAIWGRTFPH